MEAYQNLRQWLYRLRKKVQKKQREKQYNFLPGLPEGVEISRLATLCQEHFGQNIASVSHQHLSGWKSSGAYRLKINTSSGNDIFVIYKNAVYDREEIPALIDFPLIPGPPEHVILSQANGALAEFLPHVYMAEEIKPGSHYRYLLEDLYQDYRAIKGDADKQLVICQLPRLHQALDEWTKQSTSVGLLQYGPAFSAALQQYAHARLQQYQQHVDHPLLHTVLNDWPEISHLHLQPAFFTQPMQLIHGDSNYTNIHLSKHNPQHIKVVDWEWAGFASPYADLAALTKGSQHDFEKHSFRAFCELCEDCPPGDAASTNDQQRWRRYQWCVLERGLMDAAFLAAQYLNAPNQARFRLPDAIASSLRRVTDSYRQLTD